MLEKLYEIKALDYKKLILKYAKNFNLDLDGVIVLSSLLDIYDPKTTITSQNLESLTKLSKRVIEDRLAFLLDNNLLSIHMDKVDGIYVERFDITPFFIKLEAFLSETKVDQATDISKVITKCENTLNRPLMPNETDIIFGWFEDGKKFDEVYNAVLEEATLQRFSIKHIEQKLYKKRVTKTNKKLQDLYDNM